VSIKKLGSQIDGKRYNGLLFVLDPKRDNYQVAVSEDFFDPGTVFDIANLPINVDGDSSWTWGHPPAATLPIPGVELSSVTALQSSLDLLRVHNTSVNWESLDVLQCWEKFANSTDSLRPNIVFVLNWTSPDSSNTALAIGSLGYSGGDLLTLCPESFYNNTDGGLQVLNASTTSPGFYTLSGIYTDPEVEVIGDNNCPYRYSPVPSYQPQTVPRVSWSHEKATLAPTLAP